MQTTISRLTTGRTRNIYNDVIKQLEFVTPHDFIPKAYGIYKKNYPNNPSINGRIFEYLICESLAKISLTPLSEKEVKPLKKNIQEGGIYGLDSCVIVSSPDFDILLNKLKEKQFVEGEEIMPVNGTFFNVKS